MDIYYATTNTGKLQSLQRRFEGTTIRVVQVPMDIPEPRSSDVQVIAVEKVIFAYKQLNEPVAALDAGFYISSVNGFPRAFVNFALETVGLEGILKLVDGKDRSCEFRECLGYLDASLAQPKLFTARIAGTLAAEPRGAMQPHLWSTLGLIFVPDGKQVTLGEMDAAEYAQWSKYSKEAESASCQFAKWLSGRS
ncbi:hypothetical protein HY642_00540 [Candidatus Woesearchaeota archaeon]|nr:hypothetical protein [Candidatus Woesearchaeota archaeon]